MFKIGDKVTVIKNSYGHNYTIGKTYKVHQLQNNNIYVLEDENGVKGNSIPYENLEILMTKEYVINKISKTKKTLIELRKKLNFLNENNIDEFDDKTFKVINIINIMNKKKYTIEELIPKIKEIISDDTD